MNVRGEVFAKLGKRLDLDVILFFRSIVERADRPVRVDTSSLLRFVLRNFRA